MACIGWKRTGWSGDSLRFLCFLGGFKGCCGKGRNVTLYPQEPVHSAKRYAFPYNVPCAFEAYTRDLLE